MRNLLLGAASLAALSITGVAYAQSRSLADDAAAFGAREAVGPIDFSPDGNQVLYLTPASGMRTTAVVGNLSNGQFRTAVTSDGNPESLQFCGFVTGERIVCEIAGLITREDLTDFTGFSRLVSMDADGSNPKMLGQTASFYDAWMRNYDGEIIDWLSNGDGTVMISRSYIPEEGKIGTRFVRGKRGIGVDRVDVRTLRSDSVEPPKEDAGYMTDGRGVVRLMSIVGTRNSGMLTGDMRYFYRTPDSRDWKPLVTVRDVLNPDFVPLAVDSTINALYALKKKSGRYALYSVRLDGSMAETLIAENPRVDIDDVIRVGKGLKVIGYTFAEEDRQGVYFDPEFRSLAASLGKALPKLPMINFAGASRDGNKLLIIASSDNDPGRYYVFDRAKKTLNEAMLARPQLEGRTLASVKPVTVPAPDGTQIPAYLTLPPGKDPKGLPAVVLPHGGPSARDEWGFDWLAQFLAARGYAVLQPNYRGSAGFGDSWLKDNGFKSWRTSIGDISASAKWLAAQGIASPDKLAIVGWSYGGYAALQSSAVEPSLYKAVVAIAPVTDLQLLKDDARNYADKDLVDRFVGSGPHVADGSPLRRAGSIAAPVLLVHGKVDVNVRYSHSQKMDAALRAGGKASELISFDRLDHGLEDSAARTQMLTRIGALLDRTVGR